MLTRPLQVPFSSCLRIWRVPLGASIVGSLSSFIVFPSFSFIFGFSTLLSIVPDAAMGAALMMVAAGISYSVTHLRWKTIASGTVFIALWLCFIIYSNPTWFVGAGFIFAPLLAFCILDARSAQVVAARIAAFLIAFALLDVLGPVMATSVPSSPIRPAFTFTASGLAPRTFCTHPGLSNRRAYCGLMSSSCRAGFAGLIFGGRSERKAAFVSLLLFAVFLLEVSAYLFVPIHWPATVPVYSEVLMGPIYAFGAIVGYSAFFAYRLAQPDGVSFSNVTATSSLSSGENARHIAPLRGFIAAVPVLSGIAFVPALGAWYVTDEIYAHTYTPNLINALTEPWPETDELDKYLGDNIGVRSTNQFRGMTLLNSIFSYETSLVVASLWGRFVPFLNMYSTFYMPGLYYFITHFSPGVTVAQSSSETMAPSRALWTYGPSRRSFEENPARVGSSLCSLVYPEGDERRPPDDAVLRLEVGPITVAGRQFTQKVYEYSDANVGNCPSHQRSCRAGRAKIYSIFGVLHLIRVNQSFFRKESRNRLSRQPPGRCFSNAVPFASRQKAGHLTSSSSSAILTLPRSERCEGKPSPSEPHSDGAFISRDHRPSYSFGIWLVPPRVSQPGPRRLAGTRYF